MAKRALPSEKIKMSYHPFNQCKQDCLEPPSCGRGDESPPGGRGALLFVERSLPHGGGQPPSWWRGSSLQVEGSLPPGGGTLYQEVGGLQRSLTSPTGGAGLVPFRGGSQQLRGVKNLSSCLSGSRGSDLERPSLDQRPRE